MKKTATVILLLTLLHISQHVAGQQTKYPVVFYNLENLFDTINTPNVQDEEFTPESPKAWNSEKYWKKMANIEKVFYSIAATAKTFPTIIGVSEIENRSVLEDLISTPKLQKANYQIVHYDSPGARGIDVGLLYRPDQFKMQGSKSIKTRVEGYPDFVTRDVLMVWGTIENEPFYFFVCHWPSRRGGQYESEKFRFGAAQTVRSAIDSVMQINPQAKVLVMGDLNDDPVDKSIYNVLKARGDDKQLKDDELFNPYYKMYKAGYGTLAYQDAWNIFDNIIVNQNLLHAPEGKLTLLKSNKNKYYGNIFNKPFMCQKDGQYKNYPLRTYVGDNFQDGFSDHFPVYIYIAKQ